MTTLSSTSDAITSMWQQSEPPIQVATFDSDLELAVEENQPRLHNVWYHHWNPSQNPILNRPTREIPHHFFINTYDIGQECVTGEFWPTLSSAPVVDFVAQDILRWIQSVHVTTLTESLYRERWIDLFSTLYSDNAEKREHSLEALFDYGQRIEILRDDGDLDGITVNKASVQDFWSFVESVPFASKAEIVLVDNGNLRAVWDGEDGSHLGFQFLGDHMVQYVIFRRRHGSGHVSRVAGRDTLEGVKRQVRNFDLETLLKV